MTPHGRADSAVVAADGPFLCNGAGFSIRLFVSAAVHTDSKKAHSAGGGAPQGVRYAAAAAETAAIAEKASENRGVFCAGAVCVCLLHFYPCMGTYRQPCSAAALEHACRGGSGSLGVFCGGVSGAEACAQEDRTHLRSHTAAVRRHHSTQSPVQAADAGTASAALSKTGGPARGAAKCTSAGGTDGSAAKKSKRI